MSTLVTLATLEHRRPAVETSRVDADYSNGAHPDRAVNTMDIDCRRCSYVDIDARSSQQRRALGDDLVSDGDLRRCDARHDRRRCHRSLRRCASEQSQPFSCRLRLDMVLDTAHAQLIAVAGHEIVAEQSAERLDAHHRASTCDVPIPRPTAARTTRHRDGVERCGCAAGRAGPAHRQEARPQTGRHAATPDRPDPPPRLPRRVGGEAVRRHR